MQIPQRLRFESKLLSVINLNETVKEFVFSTPKEFDFLPGQFATVLFVKNEKTYRRAYSILSQPTQKEKINLCIKDVAGGIGTTYLWSLKIGDTVNMMAPMGVFVVKDEHKFGPLTFISTGTGVAPFICMIQNLLTNNYPHQITLICGYRHDLLYHELLTDLANKHKNFTYLPTLTQPRPTENYKGTIGRIGQIVETQISDYSQVSFGNSNDQSEANNNNSIPHFYICGLYDMIKDVCTQLINKKIPKTNIHFERYD